MASAPNEGPTAPTPPAAKSGRSSSLLPGGWVAVTVILGVVILLLLFQNPTRISVTAFEKIRDGGEIKAFKIIGQERAYGEVRDPKGDVAKANNLTGGLFSVLLPHTDNTYRDVADVVKEADRKARAQKNDGADPVVVSVEEEQLSYFGPLLWSTLLLAAFVGFVLFFILPRIRESNGGGFINNYIRSPARRYEKGKTRTTFEDVAGMDAAKRELQEVVDFLRNPDKFTRLGAQVPKGVLLVGPPGTGKTLLAKAVAGEANVPFYNINGSEFIQMFVGVGASRVRDLFKTAKEHSPCVIFIDEIDAVGRMRGAGVGGGSDEREQTLNQILSEMDGFQPSETVIVLAATNRPDVLDSALLRPGRFDRHITVARPTWQGRLAILKVHTRNKPLADTLDLERIARGMIGMSGAELRNLCNEAALIATREGKNKIDQGDFDQASDRVRLGAKREEAYGEEEKRRTAYHEAGHALCAWLEPKTDPIERVSIVPRGRAGGFTLFSPDEDRIDHSYTELLAELVVAIGGRAADRLVFGEPMSGAIGDLKHGTKIARMMVTQFGMSEKLGPVSYRAGEDHPFLGKEMAESRDFSEGTARIIDEEVQRILSEAETRAYGLLQNNREDLDRLANALLQQEELDREAVDKLLRKSPAPEKNDQPSEQPEAAPQGTINPKLAFGGA
ncbi:ATP-dependent zinc metalloprotease FtsH [Limnoglobus roseus]|uniref:ATP-dependent zinc metalloprotease FtsH n=1 Tax=Limnoglobus roseus TaxID=2598579 RepID=A0A5C1AM01_9BACT|nr:ATP-dependent zinc metalloprotease FtsH [Limnoglobus roseus]QEL18996.1 ATP-dependent zinc metalloprotease FtsH [Limnoglobus roseus]